MTKNLARLQDEFQRAVLDGDDRILGEIRDGPRASRAELFEVYRRAYALRLLEALRNSYELTSRYVGDETFEAMGRAYIAAHPSKHPNVRWYGGDLARFLAATPPYADYPILTELAALESTLNDAFDAADDRALSPDDLRAIAPENWHALVFRLHPSARRLGLVSNALAVWLALRDDTEVPEAAYAPQAAPLIVWRQDATAMVRALDPQEAMMWDEAAAGLPFGQLCTMLATIDDPAHASERAAGYLGQWVTTGLLSDAVIP